MPTSNERKMLSSNEALKELSNQGDKQTNKTNKTKNITFVVEVEMILCLPFTAKSTLENIG